MKKKVLMIGSDLNTKGGITSVIKQLLNNDWSLYDVEMRFLPTHTNDSNIKRILFFFKQYIKLFFVIISFNPDILHIHMSYNGSFHRKYLVHKLCKLFSKKDIIHLHGSQFLVFYKNSKPRTKKKIRFLLRDVDQVFVLGDEWYSEVKRIEPNSNLKIINNTVFIPSDNTKFSKTKINILFLGLLVERKGVYDLLNVVHKLEENKILEKYHVRFLIGGMGSEEKRLKDFVTKNNLNDFVEFLGWVSGKQKENLLKEAQVFVLPSYNEGLPIAILESLSYGVPVIGTNVGSVSEAIIDGYNGFLVYPGDTRELENKLEEIIINYEDRKKMGKNAKKIAKEKFDDTSYFRLIAEVYHEI